MPSAEDKRDKAIWEWVEKNRPELIYRIKDTLSPGMREIIPNLKYFYLMLSVGFEAGRQFQLDNSKEVEPHGFSVDSSR